MNMLEYPIDVALTLFSNAGLYVVIAMLIFLRFSKASPEVIKFSRRALWIAIAALVIFAAISPSNTYKHEPHDKEASQRKLEQIKRQDNEVSKRSGIEDRSLPIEVMPEEKFDKMVDWRNRPSKETE